MEYSYTQDWAGATVTIVYPDKVTYQTAFDISFSVDSGTMGEYDAIAFLTTLGISTTVDLSQATWGYSFTSTDEGWNYTYTGALGDSTTQWSATDTQYTVEFADPVTSPYTWLWGYYDDKVTWSINGMIIQADTTFTLRLDDLGILDGPIEPAIIVLDPPALVAPGEEPPPETVYASSDFTLAAGSKNLVLEGEGDFAGTGNALDNSITGNAGNNVLAGLDGNDTIDGAGGNDLVDGGAGNDIVWARGGADAVYGEGGDDFLAGGNGNDLLDGGAGIDVLQGGNGNDILRQHDGKGALLGGIGHDSITGGAGDDFIAGGKHDDTIATGGGRNVVAFNRNDRNDTILGSARALNTLSLGGGIRAGDLAFSVSGDDLVLSAGKNDSITFADWYADPANRNFVTLQLIEEAAADYDAASSDPLRNQGIQTFDFAALAEQFDQARATSPNLGNWTLMNGLLDAHLAGSDTAALGGDLAYHYGMRGDLNGMSLVSAQETLKDPSFGGQAQAVHQWSSGNAEAVRLG